MTYNEAIASNAVVLVEFYASWCPHCQKMMPVVEEIKELLEGQVPVYQFEIDEDPEDARLASVKSIPTFIVYHNGVEAWRHTGEIDGNDLLRKVQEYIS